MAENLTEVYIKLVQLAIITFVLVLLTYRYRQSKIKALYWMFTIFALAILQGLVELLIYVYKVNIIDLEDTTLFRFNELHSIPYSVAILVLFLMSEYMQDIRPQTWKLFTVLTFWSGYLFLILFDMFGGFDWSFSKDSLTLDSPPSTHAFNTVFNLFQFVAMIFIAQTFWKAYQTSYNKTTKRIALWMFLGVAIFTLVAFEEVIESIFVGRYTSIIGYRAIWYALTFLVLAYVYIRYPYYVFNVPTYIYRIILATEHGNFIYGAEMDNPNKEHTEEVSNELLASALSAMTRFMEEATRSNGTISLIDFDDRSLLVRKQGQFIGLLIAAKPTRMLKSALQQFVIEFNIEFGDKIERFYDLATFKGSEYVVARCFPFVEANDVIQLRVSS